ncbi:unnamed protein product [Protopolystoma xenopodis]|uniref:Secreted protein n=1 Tax=Protopolystoma xenopodis TaxID=117903 RepID=A0A448X9S2_9PLAT|nr:unnamed protein product [Protopolystoma xenopodis]
MHVWLAARECLLTFLLLPSTCRQAPPFLHGNFELQKDVIEGAAASNRTDESPVRIPASSFDIDCPPLAIFLIGC